MFIQRFVIFTRALAIETGGQIRVINLENLEKWEQSLSTLSGGSYGSPILLSDKPQRISYDLSFDF